jgi:hypothetical protein
MVVRVTGGAYEGREGLVAFSNGENIYISGWYDGGYPLEISISMPLDEFLEQLKKPEEKNP